MPTPGPTDGWCRRRPPCLPTARTSLAARAECTCVEVVVEPSQYPEYSSNVPARPGPQQRVGASGSRMHPLLCARTERNRQPDRTLPRRPIGGLERVVSLARSCTKAASRGSGPVFLRGVGGATGRLWLLFRLSRPLGREPPWGCHRIARAAWWAARAGWCDVCWRLLSVRAARSWAGFPRHAPEGRWR
jgi:hypothetical protein